MARQVGYLESISDDRKSLRGWAAVDSNDQLPPVTIESDIANVSAVELGSLRRDVTAAIGRKSLAITVVLNRPLPPGALLDGSLKTWIGGEKLPLARRFVAREEEHVLEWAASITGRRPASGELSETGFGRVPFVDDPTGISAIHLPVGTESRDGSAAVGRDGHLFLMTGANNLADRYRDVRSDAEAAGLEREVRGWVELVIARDRQMAALGIPFVQSIFPEKSTILRSGLSAIEGITPAFRIVDERLSGKMASYTSVLSVLREWRHRESPSLKLDGHLAPVGSYEVAKALLQKIAPEFIWPDVRFNDIEWYKGELTYRFFGDEVWDYTPSPDVQSLGSLASVPSLVARGIAGEGHASIGRTASWINPHAPIDLKVLTFGSSSFSDNAQMSAKLSWWFARLFREFHFVWSPAMDYGRIDEIGPDVVVSQTVERFLGRIPADIV